MREIRSLRGAPEHIKKWWRGTGMEPALFRLVELGASWADAHARLVKSWERWWDRSERRGVTPYRSDSPLDRLAQRVVRMRIRARGGYEVDGIFQRCEL